MDKRKKYMEVDELNNTSIIGGRLLNSESAFLLWGRVFYLFVILKKPSLFLLGTHTNKLTILLSITYNKLKYICVLTCCRVAPQTKLNNNIIPII